jgi:hypothetical protein
MRPRQQREALADKRGWRNGLVDDQDAVEALQAKVREMQGTIDAQQAEINRLTTGTALLLVEKVTALARDIVNLRHRMFLLDGIQYKEPDTFFDQ